ncbi:MAG: MBL fold metallo-hydrolase [Phycisphaerales bacterium]|nr:MBL fold metallo-hydrolase [Phycisphaerales bacterium]
MTSAIRMAVLGRAQDGGVPHIGCHRRCCKQARLENHVELPACLGIWNRVTGARVLIEATPAITTQVALLNGIANVPSDQSNIVDAICVTHAHLGHYTGLMYLGREAIGSSQLPVYVTQTMAQFLADNEPWAQLIAGSFITPRIIEPEKSFSPIDQVNIEAIVVPHRDESSDTVAFKISGPDRTCLFCPDIDSWPVDSRLMHLLFDDVDIAYVDGTFFDDKELPGRNLDLIPHPRMIQTMDQLKHIAISKPGMIRFIHLNHTNPALHDPVTVREIEARGFSVAYPGENQLL